jgi:rhodanese-related sulfurtransferase
MPAATTLKVLPFDEALEAVDRRAAFVDLRSAEAYLEVHIPGSLCLLYEHGPGLASRARDCLPLDLPLVLVDAEDLDMDHAAASLRGKGFTVLGRVDDAINRWADSRGVPATTEIVQGTLAGEGTVLDVCDPQAPYAEEAVRIPIDQLWHRIDELEGATRVAVTSGYGIRAALAVGILERAGVDEIMLWRGPRTRATE